MLQPKRTKFRKAFKGRIHGDAKGGTALNFGAFGLKAMEPERITARQIEAARRAITRHIRRQGRLWIRIFPDVPVSSKPPKSAWARARARRNSGSPASSPAASCSSWTAFPARSPRSLSSAPMEKLPIKTKVVARLGESLIEEE
jgi:large subunit ribosomal protein L16